MGMSRRTVFASLALVLGGSFQAAWGSQHSGILSLGSGPISDASCAVLADHHVVCWGSLDNAPSARLPQDVAGISKAVAVTQGSAFACALTTVGSVLCWGVGDRGQLGDGSYADHLDPRQVKKGVNVFGGVTQIAAGYNHVCTTSFDQFVWCWGDNANGELGNYSVTTDKFSGPVRVYVHDMVGNPPLGSVTKVYSGDSSSCVLLTDGTGGCWGWNRDGQLANGAASDGEVSPVTITGTSGALGIADLSLGQGYACAMVPDTTRPYHANCWGMNQYGELGNDSGPEEDANHNKYNPVPSVVQFPDASPLLDVDQLSAGGSTACALLADHTLACWGANAVGQLGDKNFTSDFSTAPVGVYAIDGSLLGSAVPIKEVQAGKAHACARNQNGDVFCWGDNSLGQLGNNFGGHTDVPLAIAIDAPIFTDDFDGD